jgi:hypothetical protein
MRVTEKVVRRVRFELADYDVIVLSTVIDGNIVNKLHW